MKSEGGGASAPVAIVGGGFSGTMAAAQLARRGISSVIVEGEGRLANGVAYSTREPAHLLNVRAEGMSAWPDAPRDFAEVIAAEGGRGEDFAERRRFAGYLQAIFAEAMASGQARAIHAKATRATPEDDCWHIGLDDGSTLEASALILAQGNLPPEPMRGSEQISPERFINNPWTADAAAAVRDIAGSDAPVLILGTGLTMIDTILSLDAAGHRGRITALSRRGQVPRAHAHFDPAPVEADEVPHGSVSALWRWLRRRGEAVGWRAAVDSLRPHSHALWQSLSTEEQRRFMRHARPWWDVHRHRIAPEVAERIRGLIAEGRLEIAAGRVAEMRETDDGLAVIIDRRRGSREALHVAKAFNCTGPLGTLRRTRDPMLKQMLGAGIVRMDHLGIALHVDADNRAGKRVWALGPLTKGRYWEMIAVPDIREQAAAVAADIATELAQ